MPNYRRVTVPGGTFFFTLVTDQRRPLLTGRSARVALRQAFEEERARRPFVVDAIVLLPDHLHAVWTLPPWDADFSTRWRRIKSLFTSRFAESLEIDPKPSPSRVAKREQSIWQRRF
ncbi:REP-associated tyrosine transposase [Botrimarina colliarenosi]